MKYQVLDLFAGCGGLVDGFLQTKSFETVAAVDWEKPTVATLANRLEKKWGYDPSEQKVIHFDLQRPKELIKGFEDPLFGDHKGLDALADRKNVNIIVGGPPCQAYSMAGRVQDKNGMRDDYRNYLFESYIEFVKYYKPKAFVFENVEGILSAQPGGYKIVDRIRDSFAKIGYEITDNLRSTALFNLSYYGVPQARKRVIIFGVPKSKTSTTQIELFYRSMKEHETKAPLTAASALLDLPKLIPVANEGGRVSHVLASNNIERLLNHEPRFHNARDISIFKELAEDIKSGAYKYHSTEALIKLYKERTGKDSKFHKYHVIRLDRPSNTIPAHLHKDGLRHIHPDPEQARSITVREAARLQTFDDDFEMIGSRGDQYKMVGNAVPPKFSKLIAEKVLEVID